MSTFLTYYFNANELPIHSFLLLSVVILITIYTWKSLTSNQNHHLPPSPPRLPIIGNLHQLGNFPHHSLRSLSQRYGKLLLLHLGTKPTLVVSSPDVAKEIMKTHDVIFSNRPKLRYVNEILHGAREIAFGSYGEEWRRNKNIAVTKLLNSSKVRSFRTIREEEVGLMIENIKSLQGSTSVNLSGMFLRLMNDMVSRTTLGKKYRIDQDGSGVDADKLFRDVIEIAGAVCVGDFIPWLGWIDRISGLHSKAMRVRKSFDNFIDSVVKEHDDLLTNRLRTNKSVDNEESCGDFVEILLQIQRDNPTSLSNDNIHGILLDMFVGAIETTQALLEWTMTELLRTPKVMKKLKKEVRQIINNKKSITEDDLSKMHYLKAVIKETLRLHPPLPLLIFRESSQSVEINGYKIDAGTQVIINAWAIQRDADLWDDHENFDPERFLINSSIDFKGNCIEYMPFGVGRRSCPGMYYGLASSELVLATLLYEFDWKLAENESLNVEEAKGIVSHPRHSLRNVIATKK